MLHKTLWSAALATVAGIGLLLAPGISAAHGGGGGGGGHGGGGGRGGFGGFGQGSSFRTISVHTSSSRGNLNRTTVSFGNTRNGVSIFTRATTGTRFNGTTFNRTVVITRVSFGTWGWPWGWSLPMGWGWYGGSGFLFGSPSYYTPAYFTTNNLPAGNYFTQWYPWGLGW